MHLPRGVAGCLLTLLGSATAVQGLGLYKIKGVSTKADEEGRPFAVAPVSDFNFDAVNKAAKGGALGDARASSSRKPQLQPKDEPLQFELPLEQGGTRMVQGTIRMAEVVEGEENTYRVYGTIPSWNAATLGEDATFTMYINTRRGAIDGNVMAGEDFWAFDSESGGGEVKKIDKSLGICILNKDGHIASAVAAATAAASAPASANHTRALGEQHTAASHASGRESRKAQGAAKPHACQHETHGHRARRRAATTPTRPHRQLRPSRSRGLLIFLDLAPQTDAGGMSIWGGLRQYTLCNNTADMPEWLRVVREDYAPFNATVTDDRAVFKAWKSRWGPRVRVGIADTAVLGRGLTAGVDFCGAAVFNSARQQDNVIWVSCSPSKCGNARAVGQTISHEVGHTFGLKHDGSVGDGEYLFGLPRESATITEATWPLSRRWNTIMGTDGSQGLVQWSKGEYADYTLARKLKGKQDDLAVISRFVGPRVGGGCNRTLIPIQDFSTGAGRTWEETAITCGNGNDSYYVRFFGPGTYSIQVSTSRETNLKFRVSIESGTSLTTIKGRGRRPAVYRLEGATLLQQKDSDPYHPIPVTLSGSASSGLHRVVIKSIGQEESSATAGHKFSSYGSVGAYTLSITPPPPAPNAAIVDLLAGADPEATSRAFSKRMWKRDDEGDRAAGRSEDSAKRPTREPK